MKINKLTLLSFAVIGLFVLSVNGTVNQVSSQETISTNFELLLMTNSGNRIRESYAFFIKQAVAPLGIDVEIQAKPFGQFVGDLLHLSTGTPFDLAIIGFSGGGPVPSLKWKFHSVSAETSFGVTMYQLNDAGFQQHLQSDQGISQEDDVNALLEDIEYTTNMTQLYDYVMEFTQMYMEDLLYDLPLTTPDSRVSTWTGWGDDGDSSTCVPDFIDPEQENCVNDLYYQQEGAFFSHRLGADWLAGSPGGERFSATGGLDPLDTWQARIGVPQKWAMFDGMQSTDTSTTAESAYLTMNLLTFDQAFKPHPAIAYNYMLETWDNDSPGDTSDDIEGGKYTFFINTDTDGDGNRDWVWDDALDKNGNNVAGEAIDANDFKMYYELYQQSLKGYLSVNGKDAHSPVNRTEVSTTVFPDDTLTVYIEKPTANDLTTFGSANPIPEHILGGSLELLNGTTFDFYSNPGHSPWATKEWRNWATTIDGNTQPGEYEIVEHDQASGFLRYEASDSFQFPNEWDSEAMWDTYSTNFTSAGYNGLSHFAPHVYENAPDAYFWAYESNEVDRVKPTVPTITDYIVKVIPDTNAALISFEAGSLDVFGASSLGAAVVNDHTSNPDFHVRTSIGVSGPTLLVFNLLNEHLQQIEVRRAFAYGLDRQEMTSINDGFATVSQSPVWLVYDLYKPDSFVGAAADGSDLSWYNDEWGYDYSYSDARDIMRGLGYDARETENPVTEAPPPPYTEVVNTVKDITTIFNIENIGEIVEAGSTAWIGFSALAVTSVVLVRRLRKY